MKHIYVHIIIKQGRPDKEGRNISECENCSNTLCLICGDAGVKMGEHFYGQVKLHKMYCVLYNVHVLPGRSTNRAQTMSLGGPTAPVSCSCGVKLTRRGRQAPGSKAYFFITSYYNFKYVQLILIITSG